MKDLSVERKFVDSVDILNESKSTGFGSLLDAIFVDGGITQLRAAKLAIDEINSEIREKEKEYGVQEIREKIIIPIYGMVKKLQYLTSHFLV